MYPQQLQGQAFTPQGYWGTPNPTFGQNPNDVVNLISRILPLLQLQQLHQPTVFGFPQQFAPQAFGQPAPLFGSQLSPFSGQMGAFGHSQLAPQVTNLVEAVNVLARILPVLQQSGLLTQHGWNGQHHTMSQPGNAVGFPQQHFGAQGIHPEIVNAISRILPFLGTQTNPIFQTGISGFGPTVSPFIQ